MNESRAQTEKIALERRKRRQAYLITLTVLYSAVAGTTVAYLWAYKPSLFTRTPSAAEVQDLRIEAKRLNDIWESLKPVSEFKMPEIAEIDKRMKAVENQTLAIRQAINPIAPEEIITIARLADHLSIINDRLDRLERDTDKKMAEHQSSVIRELDSFRFLMNIILLGIVPLVVNFLYSFWKDFRTRENTKSH